MAVVFDAVVFDPNVFDTGPAIVAHSRSGVWRRSRMPIPYRRIWPPITEDEAIVLALLLGNEPAALLTLLAAAEEGPTV